MSELNNAFSYFYDDNGKGNSVSFNRNDTILLHTAVGIRIATGMSI